jgi:hypothetical protein
VAFGAGILVRLAALFGVTLTPAMAGALIWASIAGGALWYRASLISEGRAQGESACEARFAVARAAEEKRQRAANELIRERDLKIASLQKERDEANQRNIHETPPGTNAKCLDRDRAIRIERVR